MSNAAGSDLLPEEDQPTDEVEIASTEADFETDLIRRIRHRLNVGAIPRILEEGAHPYMMTQQELAGGFLIAAAFNLKDALFSRKLTTQKRTLCATIRLVSEQYAPSLAVSVFNGANEIVWVICEGSLQDASTLMSMASSRYIDDCPHWIKEILPEHMRAPGGLPFGFANLNEIAAQGYERDNWSPDEWDRTDTERINTLFRMMRVTIVKRLWRARLMGDMVRLGRELSRHPQDDWRDLGTDRAFQSLRIDNKILWNLSTQHLIGLAQGGAAQADAIDKLFEDIVEADIDTVSDIIAGYGADPHHERVIPRLDEWYAYQAILATARNQRLHAEAAAK